MIKFHENQDLNKLRLYTSNAVVHEVVPIDNQTKENRSKCALCSGVKAKMNAKFKCSICDVPLCTSIFKFE